MTCSLVTRLDDNLRFVFLSALVKGLSFVFSLVVGYLHEFVVCLDSLSLLELKRFVLWLFLMIGRV